MAVLQRDGQAAKTQLVLLLRNRPALGAYAFELCGQAFFVGDGVRGIGAERLTYIFSEEIEPDTR